MTYVKQVIQPKKIVYYTHGFALPTILIASIVMITVLLVSVSSSTAVRNAIKNQYYSQLAQVAGEAGIVYAQACLAQNGNVPLWSDTKPLTPATDCSGNSIATNVLVVAGGGGGATDIDVGGGGGGGGFLTGSLSLSAQSYPVTVGAGGARGTGSDNTGVGGGTNGTQGGNSIFSSMTAIGGGYGGTRSQPGGSGGSGGGGGDSSQPGGLGTSGQGYNGGAGPGMNTQSGNDSGGGGGAGGAASYNTPGVGLFSSIGNATFAKGGRGAQLISPADGAANTGDGGTGARAGGSGIVVVSYPTGSVTVNVTGAGNSCAQSGGNTVCKFVASGSFNVTAVSLMTNGNVRSNFSIGLPSVGADGRAITIPSTGFVEILRASNSAVWRRYEQKSVLKAVVPDLCSGSTSSVLGWSNAVVAGTGVSFPETMAQQIKNISGTPNVGPMYFRKDFSVTDAGAYTLNNLGDDLSEAFIDGSLVSTSAWPTVNSTTVNLAVGCHTVMVKLTNGGILANTSGLNFSLKLVGSSSPLVVSDKSWRVSKGEDRHYSEVNYFADSNRWTAVRDIQAANTTSAGWGAASGDVDSRWINTTHSYDGSGNYPSGQFTLFRDGRDINLAVNTSVKITMLCDIACYPYIDGALVNTGIGWPTISSFTVNLVAGVHKFAFMGSNDSGASGFAFAAVASDGTVLSRSDGSWSAANFWSAANPTATYSYDNTYRPNPDPRPVAQCPCNQYQAAVLASGPLAYWPLNETSGTTATDISGGARNGTYYGLVTQNQSGAMLGASNRSVLFGGVGNVAKISLPVNAIWNRTAGQAFSVETWIKPNWTQGYRDIVVNRGTSGTYNWILYQHITDGSLQLHGAAQNKSTYIPTNGVWSHVVATVDTSSVSRLYVNGTLVQTVAGYAYGASPGSVVHIGNGPSDVLEPFVGNMSDVALYTKALSQAEISAHYAARLLP